MQAGKLNERIVIEKNTPVRNSYGELVPGWATYTTVWAGVSPKSVTEGFKSNQELAQAVKAFRIRHRTDLTEQMRIKRPNGTSPETYRYYNIIGFEEIGHNEGLDILAMETVGDE